MTPHKCPVCEGRTTVPAGFYHQGSMGLGSKAPPETCRACDGKGVVWATASIPWIRPASPLPSQPPTLPDIDVAAAQHDDPAAAVDERAAGFSPMAWWP